LGLFARVPLVSGQAVGEYGGPRLPSSLHTNGQYVLQVPDSNEVIDGAYENSPYDDGPHWPVVFANHSRAPNAQLEYWPIERPGACEVRGHMWIVASEPIAAGSEIRIDYESEAGTYWLSGQPPETLWRIRGPQPLLPPSVEEPLFRDGLRTSPGRLDHLCSLERLQWEGEGGGDERLLKLVPLLIQPCNWGKPCRAWGLVATHLPGRTGRECFDRWMSRFHRASGDVAMDDAAEAAAVKAAASTLTDADLAEY